jgi:hypothetical protein
MRRKKHFDPRTSSCAINSYAGYINKTFLCTVITLTKRTPIHRMRYAAREQKRQHGCSPHCLASLAGVSHRLTAATTRMVPHSDPAPELDWGRVAVARTLLLGGVLVL